LYPHSLVNFNFFSDEKVFTVATPSNDQNIYAAADTTKKIIPAAAYYTRVHTSAILLWCQLAFLYFMHPSIKVNGNISENSA